MRHGSNLDPPNRFESLRTERIFDDVAEDAEYLMSVEDRKIEYIEDETESIVATNRSPDLPFNYSLNPYRGCIHACSYCYARPTHEYLGFNAGLDFETKIVVKKNAANLFRKFLAKPSWISEPITFSGVTDCYQPAEREFELTRQCLEVANEANQPVGIVTKNALVLRDIEALQQMSVRGLVRVYLSITTLEPVLARDMEPRTSIPAARLRAIEHLANAGIPVGVMVAPVIPGLNDSEIPRILDAAADAGATTARYVLLRLPMTVRPVFEEWVRRTNSDRAERVLGQIQSTRDGKFNDSRWGQRMVGSGVIAEQIKALFATFQKKYGLDQAMPPFNCNEFRRPDRDPNQRRLF